MAQILADRRDINFVLHEQFEVGNLSRHAAYQDFGSKVMDMVVTEARNLAVKEIYPTWKTGDQMGCTYENGTVTTPEGFKTAWQRLVEGEWLAMDRATGYGGQGMPETLAMAAREYLIAGNMALMMFAFMTHGTGRLIERFGTDIQKALYLKKVYSGQWGASMMLTEAEAGSDLSGLTTTATPNPDGTYAIAGNKIFISGAESDLTENMIHPVLARIEGAPPGSAGISLFLVPKYRVNADGSLGEFNDVVCTGIEEKMGIHGSPTCSVALGGKGNCRGTLLGRENRGLAAMFVMMNEARLMTGTQGLACASAAYLHALNYARTRLQGSMVGAREKTQVSIINHPDVRRMLLNMKMYVEGMRSLLYFVASREDRKHLSTDEGEKETLQNLIDVLIPVAKGYATDRAVDICSLGIQVFGGYGFTKEYPVEQLLRDVRVTAIYEGTNGIQAMDLLGRKLRMKDGRLIDDLTAEIGKTLTAALELDRTRNLADKTEAMVAQWRGAARHLAQTMTGPEIRSAYAHACPFLDVTGDVVMAWMLLWRAVLAARNLAAGTNKKDTAYYEGQLKSAEQFINTILPVTSGRAAAVMQTCRAAVDITDDAFGGR